MLATNLAQRTIATETFIKVLTAEAGVAAAAEHTVDPILDHHDRDVEGSAAEIEDQNGAVVGEHHGPALRSAH